MYSTENKKIVYLLIGPKGSGKSFIGSLMEEKLGVKFIRVEDLVKAIRRDRQISDTNYVAEAFHVIEKGVREALNHYHEVVFESTGLTDYFDQMLERLQQDFFVITIRITAGADLCMERVRNRDQSMHIDVSDDKVDEINRQVGKKSMKTDFVLVNEGKSASQLIEEVKSFLNK